MSTALAILTWALIGLAWRFYRLEARMRDLETQSDADLRVAAWEARIGRTEERLLDTAVRCESRAMAAGWQQTEDKAP